MLRRWDQRIVDQSSDVPSIIFSYLLTDSTLYLHFWNMWKNKKNNWNNFCKEFCKKLWKKNDTWNIRCLVDKSFVPANQQTRVLYFRLSDFSKSMRVAPSEKMSSNCELPRKGKLLINNLIKVLRMMILLSSHAPLTMIVRLLNYISDN